MERMIMIPESEYKQLKRKANANKHNNEEIFNLTKLLAAKALSTMDQKTYINLINWARAQGLEFKVVIDHSLCDKEQLYITYDRTRKT